MFDVPGFDPSSMSDDELMSRHMELSRRLSWASRFGSGEMGYQLQSMMISIEGERRDRLLRYMFKERSKLFPDTIETEPDLAEEHKQKVVADDSNDRMAQRRRVGRERAITKTSEPHQQMQIPTRTSTPQTEGESPAASDEDKDDNG